MRVNHSIEGHRIPFLRDHGDKSASNGGDHARERREAPLGTGQEALEE